VLFLSRSSVKHVICSPSRSSILSPTFRSDRSCPSHPRPFADLRSVGPQPKQTTFELSAIPYPSALFRPTASVELHLNSSCNSSSLFVRLDSADSPAFRFFPAVSAELPCQSGNTVSTSSGSSLRCKGSYVQTTIDRKWQADQKTIWSFVTFQKVSRDAKKRGRTLLDRRLSRPLNSMSIVTFFGLISATLSVCDRLTHACSNFRLKRKSTIRFESRSIKRVH
jgi:hypothetical protein